MRPAMHSGFPTVDEALGGLITGDNVVWMGDDVALYRLLARGFVTQATAARQHVLHVDLGGGDWFGNDAERLDARATGRLASANALAETIERRAQEGTCDCLVVDQLDRAVRRWGADGVLAFFSRVCPSMLQAGVTAYWSVSPSLGRPVIDGVRQITQCLLDVRDGRLQVLKAEGRSDSLLGITYHLDIGDDGIIVTASAAGGRLARGLVAVRREFGLTQAELATAAGVTASAISQAESGVRGLALDTVVTIADRLGISVDRLVNGGAGRTYHLARHDRSRRLAADGVVALAADAALGMRTYLVDLGPHETVEPPVAHHGVQTVAAIRGLVQVDVGGDRPVLRRGDALVVERATIGSWRNLRSEPASVFWVLRD